MTLSGRNSFFRAGIAFVSLCLLVLVAASIMVIPMYSGIETGEIRRSEGFISAFIALFMKANLFAVHMAVALSALYGFFVLILIFYFFEKTQCPEILFVGFFALSFSTEVIRLIIPLSLIQEIPSLYLLMATRVLLFGRYFGIFSLFAASVYAAGLEVQKQRDVLAIVAVAALTIALGVPIDIQTWDASFNIVNGYTSLFRLIETGTCIITTVSFLVAASTRGSSGYFVIGTGSILAFLGRNMILFADTWAGLGGIVLLILGMWFICTHLHKIYLWL